jgi:hypothetical protein
MPDCPSLIAGSVELELDRLVLARSTLEEDVERFCWCIAFLSCTGHHPVHESGEGELLHAYFSPGRNR